MGTVHFPVTDNRVYVVLSIINSDEVDEEGYGKHHCLRLEVASGRKKVSEAQNTKREKRRTKVEKRVLNCLTIF